MLKFFHIPSYQAWNGGEVGYTVGYTRKDDETMVITFARAGERDQFSKKVGRTICRGRFEKGQSFEIDAPKDADKYAILRTAIDAYEGHVAANYGN